jgi:serine protease
MKKRINFQWLRSLFVFLLFFVFCIPTLVAETICGKTVLTGTWNGNTVEYLATEILVILESGYEQKDVESLFKTHNATISRDFDKLGFGKIEIPEKTSVLTLAVTLSNESSIHAAEPNFVERGSFEPDDEYYEDDLQWALKNTGQIPPGGTNDADIDAELAWDITMGSSAVLIAVLDSGIPLEDGMLSHPDLDDSNNIILGPDYIEFNGVKDLHGHGTHVTGIIAAETDNDGEGIAGIASDCNILVIQVFNSSLGGRTQAFYSGVLYAVDNGADIINYSGGGGASALKELAVAYADSNNVIIVSTTGNNSIQGVEYPAAYSVQYPNVIGVGATNCNDFRGGFSNWGSGLTVVAPGGDGPPVSEGDIFSTLPNYPVTLNGFPDSLSLSYDYLGGTSMAAPIVAGIAGLILSISPDLADSAVVEIICRSAEKVHPTTYNYNHQETYGGISPQMGYGRECFLRTSCSCTS